jgi:hypothetical protein
MVLPPRPGVCTGKRHAEEEQSPRVVDGHDSDESSRELAVGLVNMNDIGYRGGRRRSGDAAE